MKDIELTVVYGGETINLQISRPVGMGGELYHVTINKYHQGILEYRGGEWFCFICNCILTGDDIGVLMTLAESEFHL